MKAQLVVKDGMIVTPYGRYSGSLVINDGKIVSITRGTDLPDAERVIDAGGRFVIPGLVDGHTHLGGKFLLEEDFRQETPGAAAGGVTTIGLMFSAPRATRVYKEFTEPEDVVPWSKCFPVAREIGEEESIVDFFITPYINTIEQAEEIPQIAKELGLTSFKFYCNLKSEKWDNIGPGWRARIGWPIPFDDGMIFYGFQKIGEIGPAGTACVHAENTELATVFRSLLQQEGRKDPAAWTDRSPEWLEAEHITRYSLFARKANCRLYIVHLSSGEGLQAAVKARCEGTNIIIETCPQYMTMTKNDPAGVLLKVNPPIRDRANNEALWAGVANGSIECIGTDHVVTCINEKLDKGDTAGRDTDPRTDIWATGSGFPGLAFSLPLLLSEGVHKGRVSLEKVVEAACMKTAYHWGLYPKKGAIQVGSDADIVILDMDKKIKVTPEMTYSRADFTIYDGMELTGWPATTILRGKVVYEDNQVTGERGYGRYLARKADTLIHPAEEEWRNV